MTAQSRFQLASNTLLAAVFIGGFYFTTAKNIEGKTVRDNVRAIFPDFTLPALPASIQSQMCNRLTGFTDAIQRPDDSAVIQNNEELLSKGKDALKKVLLYGGMLLAFIYFTKRKQESFSFKRIAVDSLWSISAIAAAELTFFYLIVGNATYIDRQDVVNAYIGRSQRQNDDTYRQSLTGLA